MAELISGPLTDSLAEQAQGRNALQATTGEVLGAEATSAFLGNPTIAVGRQNLRNYGTTWMDPDAPPDVTPAEPTMSADDANKAYGIPGSLAFKAPVSASVAKSLNLDHQAEIDRQNTIERRGDSILTGGVARVGTDLLAGLLDPLNVASAFIPVVPEAFVAGRLAAASGVFERAAIRAGVGAAEGAAGQAALEPLNAGIAYEDHNAYGLGEALRNIAFGAAIGGGLHAGLGGLFDRVARADPEARGDALRAALAQTIEDRPVDVAPLFDAARAGADEPTLRDPLAPEAGAPLEPEHAGPLQEDAAKAAEHDGPIPDWMVANHAQAIDTASKLGLTDRVREMANEGRTAQEISAALDGKLSAAEVRVIRESLGIEPAGPAGFVFGPDIPSASASARAVAQRAMSPAPDPGVARAERANTATVETAPKVEPDVNKQLAEATQMAQEAQQAVQREVAAGRMQESEAGLAIAEEHEDNAKAVQAAAACLMARGF